MKKYYIIFSLLLSACSQENKSVSQEKNYFDLINFIQQKTTQLTNNKPIVKKEVMLDGKKEVVEIKKIDWQKELELFNQADINKQAYQTSYDKIETPFSLTYTLKQGEDLPVKSLRIELDSLEKTPKSIAATIQTKNYLYDSEKNLQMTLRQGNVKHYQIKSSQELFWGSKKEFSINGEIEN